MWQESVLRGSSHTLLPKVTPGACNAFVIRRCGAVSYAEKCTLTFDFQGLGTLRTKASWCKRRFAVYTGQGLLALVFKGIVASLVSAFLRLIDNPYYPNKSPIIQSRKVFAISLC